MRRNDGSWSATGMLNFSLKQSRRTQTLNRMEGYIKGRWGVTLKSTECHVTEERQG